MRVIRGALAGAVALTVVLTVDPGVASAAPPTAPYTVFTVNGGANNLISAGTEVLDESNATLTVEAWDRGLMFTAEALSGRWTAGFAPPVDATIVPGTRYQTRSRADATHASFALQGGFGGCPQSGWLEVEEFTQDAETGAPTTFAATYETACEGRTEPMSGELRWRSAVGYEAVRMGAGTINFGTNFLGNDGGLRTVTLASAGSLPVTVGNTSLTNTIGDGGYRITADSCSGATLAHGETCAVELRLRPTSTGNLVSRLIFAGDGATQRAVILTGYGQVSAKGTYHPVQPARLLDTRTGLGAPRRTVLDREVIDLQVTGRGGVPASGVSAVVLNVTATGPSQGGYLTAYPAGAAQPTSSNVNFNPGQTIANSVTVQVGAGGRVAILHRGGSTHIVADVAGYHLAWDAPPTGIRMGGEYYSTTPHRILDTRDPSFGGRLPGGGTVTVAVDYGAATNPHIRALAVNITAVNPQAGGHLTSWDGANPPPASSTLNFTPGRITPNMAIVPVAPCPTEYACAGLPSIGIHNGSGGGTDVLVDIFGLYDDGTIANGLRFRPLSPTRIVDTRIGLGLPGAIGPDGTATITASAPAATPDTRALAINATAIAPTANTYLSIWPAGMGLDRPAVSTLNPYLGETVPNATIARVGPTNGFHVYNRSGNTNLAVDVAGSFEYLPQLHPADRSARGLPGTAVLEPVSAPAPVRRR